MRCCVCGDICGKEICEYCAVTCPLCKSGVGEICKLCIEKKYMEINVEEVERMRVGRMKRRPNEFLIF